MSFTQLNLSSGLRAELLNYMFDGKNDIPDFNVGVTFKEDGIHVLLKYEIENKLFIVSEIITPKFDNYNDFYEFLYNELGRDESDYVQTIQMRALLDGRVDSPETVFNGITETNVVLGKDVSFHITYESPIGHRFVFKNRGVEIPLSVVNDHLANEDGVYVHIPPYYAIVDYDAFNRNANVLMSKPTFTFG